jgi:glycosyltransferase involved in cell wall biosynthesis
MRSPQDSRAPQAHRSTSRRRIHADPSVILNRIAELGDECARLKHCVAQTERERDDAVQRMHAARHELGEIHNSRAWRLWMMTLSIRRLGSAPFALVLAVPRRAVQIGVETVRRLGSLATRLGRIAALAAGRIVLETGAASKAILASVRKGRLPCGHAHQALPSPPEPSKKRRILIVVPYPIHPPNHGGGVRLHNLIRRLTTDFEIYLLIYSQQGEDPEQRAALEKIVKRVDFHHWVPRHRPDLLNLTPPNAQLFQSDRANAKIRDIVELASIDVVQLEYAELGQLAAAIPEGVPVIVTEHDIAFRQHRRRHDLRFGDRFPESKNYGCGRGDLLRLFRYELKIVARADQVHTMSAEDGRYLSRFLPGIPKRTWVVPNGVDTSYYDDSEASEQRSGVLYVGNYQNLPNVDALEYFVEDIWPLVRLRDREARLSVVGANVDDRVRRFDGRDGITVVGAVPSLRPYYHSHRLIVAPIRAGSGTRLKILEAFAAGIPVISTSLGAEGIEVTNENDILIRDQPNEFAEAVVDLINDELRCRKLAENARRLASERYDWGVVADTLRDALQAAAAGRNDAMLPPGPLLAPDGSSRSRRADVSVVIPTLNGGAKLEACLTSIRNQQTDLRIEIVCVDSGSIGPELETMRRLCDIVHAIDKRHFQHGLTRDLGARLSSGRWLVFLTQDAVPVGDLWLQQLIEPLRVDRTARVAAVQGGIQEVADQLKRFYWDSCGERFYFTRESRGWIERFRGIGFSTVHCAIRRDVWQRHPFGSTPMMEDKKWQREVVDAGFEIVGDVPARVEHTHFYDLRSLLRRCVSEGFGWRLLGEHYRFGDMVADLVHRRTWRDRREGLRSGGIRTGSEKWFPVLRPAAVWWGNNFSRRVLH